jgi:putative tryptophan/tyrosine transport system substrate-binding protein
MSGVGRREFVALLGGAVAAWPLVAGAEQARKHRLGVLLYSTPQADQQMERLRAGLRERGYVEGQNLAISYHFAEGKPERLPEKAAALAHEIPT